MYRKAKPAFHKTAKDKAMCDLQFSSLSRCGRKLGQQNRGIDMGDWRERAYKKDINGYLPTHVRLLGYFDLRDKPVQPLSNLLP